MENVKLRFVLIGVIANEHPPPTAVVMDGGIGSGKALEQDSIRDPSIRKRVRAIQLHASRRGSLRQTIDMRAMRNQVRIRGVHRQRENLPGWANDMPVLHVE